MNLDSIRKKNIQDQYQFAEKLGLVNFSRLTRQDLVFHMIKQLLRKGEKVKTEGVLDIVSDGYGFLRSSSSSYLAGSDDIYVSPTQIRRFGLRTGDTIAGEIRPPKDGERYFALLNIETVNFETPAPNKRHLPFRDLKAEFPTELFVLESENAPADENLTAQIIDMVAPLGKGQRSLIVSPPKAGKTMMMQAIAHAITRNNPKTKIICLLIDERPEEVTEMEKSIQGEVIASTFDESAARHVQVAEMVISKAKRLVEHNHDVVIFLDSITRLARAYNTLTPSSGKVLTGGVDANALQRPKRFFGAARNISKGSSLTIIGTCLVDTGSKMDEVIYEEFKGTGNNEIHLDRNIAQRRTYPAISINLSGTRREELLMSKERLANTWILRKYIQTMEPAAGLEFLIERLKKVKSLDAFFKTMKSK
ncbi:MAG TPA: transcription termination factor Rho [Gammaproteobacteria bacterium]|nr:transcription termination factor Rho [Gammaproteobacteria bacterium]